MCLPAKSHNGRATLRGRSSHLHRHAVPQRPDPTVAEGGIDPLSQLGTRLGRQRRHRRLANAGNGHRHWCGQHGRRCPVRRTPRAPAPRQGRPRAPGHARPGGGASAWSGWWTAGSTRLASRGPPLQRPPSPRLRRRRRSASAGSRGRRAPAARPVGQRPAAARGPKRSSRRSRAPGPSHRAATRQAAWPAGPHWLARPRRGARLPGAEPSARSDRPSCPGLPCPAGCRSCRPARRPPRGRPAGSSRGDRRA